MREEESFRNEMGLIHSLLSPRQVMTDIEKLLGKSVEIPENFREAVRDFYNGSRHLLYADAAGQSTFRPKVLVFGEEEEDGYPAHIAKYLETLGLLSASDARLVGDDMLLRNSGGAVYNSTVDTDRRLMSLYGAACSYVRSHRADTPAFVTDEDESAIRRDIENAAAANPVKDYLQARKNKMRDLIVPSIVAQKTDRVLQVLRPVEAIAPELRYGLHEAGLSYAIFCHYYKIEDSFQAVPRD